MRKANLGDHPVEASDRFVAKNGWYEDDNVVVQVRAFVKDNGW